MNWLRPYGEYVHELTATFFDTMMNAVQNIRDKNTREDELYLWIDSVTNVIA